MIDMSFDNLLHATHPFLFERMVILELSLAHLSCLRLQLGSIGGIRGCLQTLFRRQITPACTCLRRTSASDGNRISISMSIPLSYGEFRRFWLPRHRVTILTLSILPSREELSHVLSHSLHAL